MLKNQKPHVAPMAASQILLQIAALVHIFTSKKYCRGNRLLWFLLSFVNFVGPILYFTIGRACSDE